MAKVIKTEDCWEWNGANDGRYGIVWLNGRNHKAHRVAYVLAYGQIPNDLMVLHHCDNPRCVRPDHLFLGTQSDNLIDCSKKGRNGAKTHPERLACGIDNGASKLTQEQVVEMRYRAATGETYSKLAREYPVNAETVRRICRGLMWKKAGGPIDCSCRKGHKLTQDDAHAIRGLYRSGGFVYSELAECYGIDQSLVGRIVKGEVWTNE